MEDFTMMVDFDEKQNQIFIVNIELKRGVHQSTLLIHKLQKVILDQLIKESSEYRETYSQKGSKILPKVVLWSYEDPLYFKPGTKQKWVSKIKSS
jgi:hypothetical protein